MNWCCDCKNKYTNTKCDNCKSMSNFEKGDATVELLEKIKADIKKEAYQIINIDDEFYDLGYSIADLDDINRVIDKHISELKGEQE